MVYSLDNCMFVYSKLVDKLYINVEGIFFIEVPTEMIKFATNVTYTDHLL